MNANIGAAIKLTRENLGWTQKVLAEKVKISHSTLNRMESGKQAIPIETASTLAASLGLKLSRLVLIAEAISQPADRVREMQKDLLLAVQPLLQMGTEEGATSGGARQRDAATVTSN